MELEVSDNWVNDGFNPQNRIEQIQQFFEEDLLPFAHAGVETKANVKVSKR